MVSPAWTEYFTLVAGVAVGVAGILFVSIQLTRDRWRHDEVARHLLLETFSELLVPIFIALSVLLPSRWPAGWEPIHVWLLRQLTALHLSTISSIWQIVGIAASVFGWSVAARTTISFAISCARTRSAKLPSALKSGGSHPQKWIEWIPLGFTFPLLFCASLVGHLDIVGVLTLWFVFSAMFETWLIFAESPAKSADRQAHTSATIQVNEVTDEVTEVRAESTTIAINQSHDQIRDTGLSERLLNSFTSVYLTLSSIIQAGAFGYLALTVATKAASFNPTQWALAVTTLLFVVAAWNEYMMGATALIWIPQLPDSLIPFALGMAEVTIVISLYTSPTHWFLAASVFSFVSLLAYRNMYKSAENARYSSGLLRHLDWRKWLSEVYCAVGALWFLAVFAYTLWHNVATHDLLIPAVISGVVAAGFLFRGHFYWKSIQEFARPSRESE